MSVWREISILYVTDITQEVQLPMLYPWIWFCYFGISMSQDSQRFMIAIRIGSFILEIDDGI